MKSRELLLLITAAAIAPLAQAEEPTFSMGLRLWNLSWKDNNAAYSSTTPAFPVVSSVERKTEMGVIPFALVRFGNFGVSGSTLLKRDFASQDAAYATQDAAYLSRDRREWDINGLYYFLPSTSVSIGYKEVSFSPTTKVKLATAALSASAPLGEQLGLYGTFAYGMGSVRTTGFPKLDARYLLAETGLSYSLGSMVGKSAALTVGYRHQQYKALDVPVFTRTYTTTDTTTGPTIGFVVTF